MPDKLNRRIALQRDWIANEARSLLRETATEIHPHEVDPARASQRFVIVGITRRSAGEHFEELRRIQVERLGNRPSPALFARHLPQLQGVIPLATCCRFELHAMLSEEEATTHGWEETKARLTEGFAALLGDDSRPDSGAHSETDARGRLAFYRGSEAIEHLIYMAAGGLSVLPGETEILSQLKAAYRWAVEDGQLEEARDLHYIYQRAFHHTHRLHEVFFGGGGWSVSLPRLAMHRLGEWFAQEGRELPACNKLQIGFVGAGQVAGQLGRYAVHEGYRPEQLIFYVRNKERALKRGQLPEGVKLAYVSELIDDVAAGKLHGLIGAVTHPLAFAQPLAEKANTSQIQVKPLPIIDLSVPAMLGDEDRALLPPQIDYVSFEELVATRDRQNERRLGQLQRLREEARQLSRRMAERLNRNAALRGEPLEQLRGDISRGAESRFKHRLDQMLRDIDDARPEVMMRASEYRRIRNKLLGAFRHELMLAAKEYLLKEEA